MKVHIIWQGHYEDTDIVAVYADLDDAQRFIDKENVQSAAQARRDWDIRSRDARWRSYHPSIDKFIEGELRYRIESYDVIEPSNAATETVQA